MPSTETRPVIIGVGDVVQRPGSVELTEALGPIELMTAAARVAAADAGRAAMSEVDWIGATGGLYRYRNPAALVGERLGAGAPRTAFTGVSGTSPLDLLGRACTAIATGELSTALIVGGEARWSSKRLKRQGIEPSWITAPGGGTPETFDAFDPEMIAESAAIGPPVNAYALIEDSIRAAGGRTVDEQRDRAARLWERFSAVASTNPAAWDTALHSAAEIRDESADNRMIAFPYTKAMVANNTVDMASAVLVTSEAVADRLGVPAAQRVYPVASTAAHEPWKLLRRAELHSVPALADAGARVLELARVGAGDLTHVDLYACFPSIVQLSAPALGLPLDRQLSVTGGLGFAGAPIANAAGHSLTALVRALRAVPGTGLVHANGGNATKQAFVVLANEPTADYSYENRGGAPAVRDELPADWSGAVRVVAATVTFDRDGPSAVLAVVEADDGRRGLAVSHDTALFEQVIGHGVAGARATRSGDGSLSLG